MTTLRGIHLAATDPERSAAFFQALGYAPVGRDGETRQLAIVGRPEFTLTIRPGAGVPPPADFAGPGVVAVDYYTADMTEALRVTQAA
ncbi:MAG: hypothetical protein NZ518_06360, partial [Dehalococcoidia bacterium]|nr:hypothetical protein [Dehalococcoidia bacterium]